MYESYQQVNVKFTQGEEINNYGSYSEHGILQGANYLVSRFT